MSTSFKQILFFNIVNKAKNGKEISIIYVSNITSKMTVLTDSVQCLLLPTVHYTCICTRHIHIRTQRSQLGSRNSLQKLT